MNAALFAQQNFNQGSAAGLLVGLAVYFVVIILMFAGVWATFVKAGRPGWASIIPIYNGIVLIDIARKPLWWFLLMMIPFVGIIFAIIVMVAIARNFGRGGGFAIGLILLPFIFWPILGFGSSEYIGEDGAGASRRRRRAIDDYDDEDEEEDDRPRRRPSRSSDDEGIKRPRRPRDDD